MAIRMLLENSRTGKIHLENQSYLTLDNPEAGLIQMTNNPVNVASC